MKKILKTAILLLPACLAFGQQRMVLNNGAAVVISSGTSTTPSCIVIDNSNANAITRDSGYIYSENEFNIVQWNISSNTGNYVVPFGYSSSLYLPLSVDINTTPGSSGGTMKFSTYHTAALNSSAEPSDVTNVTPFILPGSPSNTDNSYNIADRFFIIDANTGYTTKPAPDNITFSYISGTASSEVASPNTLTQSRLMAQRFNSTTDTWSDWFGYGCTDAVTSNIGTVSTGPVTVTNMYRSWSLWDNTTSLPLTITGVNATSECTNNGSATATVYGGKTPYTYSWSPSGGSAASATGLSGGTYSLMVTDAGGCSSTGTITITQPLNGLSVVATTVTNVSCNTSGSTSSAVSGGTSPYTYSWSGGGGTNSTASGLAAGTYTLSVTDANGCSSSNTTIITEPAASLEAFAGVTEEVICNGGNNGIATTSATGGVSPYTYLWNDASSQTTIEATGLIAGTYIIGVTDANGCTSSASVIITQPNTFGSSAITTYVNVSCNNGNSGSALVSASGGTTPYTYLWSDASSQTTAPATGLVAGSYTVTITDACGSDGSSMESIVITQPSELRDSISVSNIICNGGTGSAIANVVGGNSPYTYLWSDANSQTTATATGLVAGTYSVSIKDACGADSILSFTITQPSELRDSISITNVLCNGGTGSAIASATGGNSPYTYLWSDGSSQTTAAATGLVAGTYSVSIKDACGADSITSITITQPLNGLSVTAVTTANVGCNILGSASSMVSGGTSPYTYSWSGGAGNTDTATGLIAGTYTLGVTDNNGCTNSATVTITQPANSILASAGTTNITCNGGSDGSALSTTTGGILPYTYLWSSGEGTNSSATGLTVGTYSLTVTDNIGCASSIIISITQPNPFGNNAAVVSNVLCNGGNSGSALANASGGTTPYTYLWNDGSSQITATATGLAAGTYTVTITDACGSDLSSTASVIISQPTILSNTVPVVTNITCNGFANGSASLNPSGGSTPYTYIWSNGETTASATGLVAGTYSVSVKDGCGADSLSNTITITQPNALDNVIASVTNNVTCNGTNSGSASVTPSGGNTPYTYLWSDASSQNTASATGLSAGTYNVSVMDACGANSISTITITQPSALGNVIASITSNVTCIGTSGGSASVSASGGSTPYTYTWSNGETVASATGLSAGTYSVSVKDGCGADSLSKIITITQPNSLGNVIASVTSNITCNGSTNGSASVSSPSGGSTPYTYTWSNGETVASATGLSAGTYSVSVKDNCGADSLSHVVTITQPNALGNVIASVTSNGNCNGNADGSASSTITGGTLPYTYTWTPSGGNNSSASNLSAGTYTLTVRDACGNLSTSSVVITEPTAIIITTDSTVETATDNGTATVNVSGGIAPYTYSWSPGGGTTSTISGLSAGSYCCTVSDVNGCAQTVCVTVKSTLGIDNISNASNISIYPNPTIGSFTITGVTQGQVIELYDYLGQKLSSTTVANNTTMHFDISTRANGVYLIRILNTDGTLATEKKMIKTQ